MDKVLVNFLVEEDILTLFDKIIKDQGRTRTSVLVEYMKVHCTDMVIRLDEQAQKINELTEKLKEQNRLEKERLIARGLIHPEDQELPSGLTTDGREEFDL